MADKNFLANGDVVLLFPEDKIFVVCSEGTGDNLLPSDIRDGFVSYVELTSYRMLPYDPPEFEEVDGGEAMFKEFVSDLTNEQLIEAIRFEMDIESKPYIVLWEGE